MGLNQYNKIDTPDAKHSEAELIEKSLQKTATEFYQDYSDSYLGKDIRNKISQPMWRSMELSKERREHLGLISKLSIENRETEYGEAVYVKRADKYVSITRNAAVTVNKGFTYGGVDIYNKKEASVMSATAVTNRVKKEKITCPHCGVTDDAYHFIDGCDYCGAHFNVISNDNKIVAFSLHKDQSGSILKMNKGFKALAITTIAIMALSFIIKFFSGFLGLQFVSHLLTVGSSMLFRGSIAGLVICVLFGGIFSVSKKKRVVDSPALRDFMYAHKGFSKDDFATQVEMKLKDIHFASKPQDIQHLMDVDASPLVQRYRRVADCMLDQLKVDSVEYFSANIPEQRIMMERVNVTTRLTLLEFSNGKIKEKKEKVKLALERYKRDEQMDELPVNMYICPNCGNSIDLLSGGKCEQCGTQLDLRDYNWKIAEYIHGGNANSHAMLILVAVIIGTAVVANVSNIKDMTSLIAESASDSNYSKDYFVGGEHVPSIYAYINDMPQAMNSKGNYGNNSENKCYTYKYYNLSNYDKDALVKYADHLSTAEGYSLQKDGSYVKIHNGNRIVVKMGYDNDEDGDYLFVNVMVYFD